MVLQVAGHVTGWADYPTRHPMFNPLTTKIMEQFYSTLQEFTLRAKELGIFDVLFNEHNMSRPDIFALVKGWAKEFYEEEEMVHNQEPGWFYYDEVDNFLYRKADELENPYVDHHGKPYEGENSWPAGGGLHKKCDYNAEALYAYYSVKNEYSIRSYLTGRGFDEVDTPANDMAVYEKGNTRIIFDGYDRKNDGGLYGYLHTEFIPDPRES